MNGFVCVILNGGVVQIGHDGGLFHHGSDDGVSGAGIKGAASQRIIGHRVGEPPCADLKDRGRRRRQQPRLNVLKGTSSASFGL